MNELKSVASGLRNMRVKPDAFLYCDNDEFYTYGEDFILEYRVFHTSLVDNRMTDEDIPWIPIWYNEGDYIISRKEFNDGYIL